MHGARADVLQLAGGVAVAVLLAGCGQVELASCESCEEASDAAADARVPRDGALDAARDAAGPTGPLDAGAADAAGDDGGSPTTVSVPVICRDAWGAQPPEGTFARHALSRLTVHHAAVVLDDNRDAPEQMRAFQRHHHGLGWPDIAYHFVVDRRGHIYEGRPVDAVGDTGTSYDPTGHFLVNAHGDFQEQHPTEAQLDAMARVLAWGASEHDISLETLAGHRAYAATSCPGDNLQMHLDTGGLRSRIDALIDGGEIALRYVCGAEGERLVESIEAGDA